MRENPMKLLSIMAALTISAIAHAEIQPAVETASAPSRLVVSCTLNGQAVTYLAKAVRFEQGQMWSLDPATNVENILLADKNSCTIRSEAVNPN
jgi:hypothetical protein